jgi:hypothetical protein
MVTSLRLLFVTNSGYYKQTHSALLPWYLQIVALSFFYSCVSACNFGAGRVCSVAFLLHLSSSVPSRASAARNGSNQNQHPILEALSCNLAAISYRWS